MIDDWPVAAVVNGDELASTKVLGVSRTQPHADAADKTFEMVIRSNRSANDDEYFQSLGRRVGEPRSGRVT
jgi:hypothetical protein